jgi:GTP-binding protein
VGLGFDFLRHVQRTRVLIHILDGAAADPLADFSQINTELALFDEQLATRPTIVAVNKTDLPEAQERWPALKAELERRGYEVFEMSALLRRGTREVLYRAAQVVAAMPVPAPSAETPVYKSALDVLAFTITREDDGGYRVSGQRIERAARMTYWEHDEAVQRFQKILEVLGVRKALVKAGIHEGDTVYIGEYELEWTD